jgi:formamidopyrimidine-DNA glycosylase
MPELPEVETIARKLKPHLVGQAFSNVEILWDRSIDRPAPDVFRVKLTGASALNVSRRGKFLVMPLDIRENLLVHLRMSGKFLLRTAEEGPGEDPYARVRLRLTNGLWVIYSDMRKFGRFYLVDDLEEIIGALGPEPLSSAFTAEVLANRLAGRRGEIKRLLLNQHFIAGLGNIYASEALWRARIHPQRGAGTLTREEIEHLHAAIIAVLKAGIANGGTSLDDRQYVYPDGGVGQHQEHLVVYDRAGDACPRCGYAVQRITQGQRSTYFCPICQNMLK